MTPFARRVYSVVSAIPRGRVLSYRDVATMAGRPRAPRAVGGALSNLPDDLEVPWWRVVSSVGRISTPAIHHTAQIQRALLEDEGVVFDRADRIDWDRFGWSPDYERIVAVLKELEA